VGKKYQYDYIYSRCSPPLERLNSMSSQGWELCGASDPYWIIRREIKTEESEASAHDVCSQN
jgi:hypothetical protein